MLIDFSEISCFKYVQTCVPAQLHILAGLPFTHTGWLSVGGDQLNIYLLWSHDISCDQSEVMLFGIPSTDLTTLTFFHYHQVFLFTHDLSVKIKLPYHHFGNFLSCISCKIV